MNNCKLCPNEISSPKLTGELCTSCFFKEKKNASILQSAKSDRNTSESSEESRAESQTVSRNDTNLRGNVEESSGSNSDSEESIKESIKSTPSVNRQELSKDIKWCQSCIERGYTPKPATREWTEGYFICDDCFQPLINNVLSISDNDIKIKTELYNSDELDKNKPLLNQFYKIFEVPEALRFDESDTVLANRNNIFNYHAPMVANKDVKQIANEIEQLQIMLFQIKIAIEPRQQYIDTLKHKEREKAQIEKIQKSKSEYVKGPSKVKQTADQKMADVLFKATISDPAERLKRYLELQKANAEAEKIKREKDFNKIIGKE